MKFFIVRDYPVVVGKNHESTTRAYQILERVKYLLQEGVPAKIILEIIEELETLPSGDTKDMLLSKEKQGD